jgi:hypothetical protein
MALPAYIDATTGAITDGEAWVALASTTLGADAASVTFTSTDDGQVGDWSQYMDLVVILYWRTAWTGHEMRTALLQLNSDTTAANYHIQALYGDGSSVSTVYWNENGLAYSGLIADDATTNAFSAMITTFLDVNSGKYKSFMVNTASDYDGDGKVQITAGTWKSQAPLTSILFKSDVGDILDESRFDLFGVLPRMVA